MAQFSAIVNRSTGSCSAHKSTRSAKRRAVTAQCSLILIALRDTIELEFICGSSTAGLFKPHCKKSNDSDRDSAAAAIYFPTMDPA
ncbi:unnamed protein product [Leptosia nina]|uniref:Uncharacterized protein n=1 Tax=Leptosia nina TaxID=320188 RepID=A0AAV1ITX6_9NEOP